MGRAIVPIAQLQRRLPEAGRIRIGKKQGNRPVAIGEFRFTSHDREALDQLAAMYGGQVRPWSDPKAAEGQFEVCTDATEIRIVLPPDPLGGSPVYEMWGGGGCERRCDGVTCEVMVRGPEGPEPTEIACKCDAEGALACKPTTRLAVVIPEIKFAGVWRLDTKSWNAAVELPGMVDLIQKSQEAGMPYGLLSVKHRRSVAVGETKKFMVPVLSVPVSIEQLTAGEGNLSALSSGTQPAVEAPAQQSIAATATETPVDPDDVEVEGEIVDLADGNLVAALQSEIDDLTQPQRVELGAWWKGQRFPKIDGGDLTVDQVDAIRARMAEFPDPLDTTATPAPTADENGDPIPGTETANPTDARNRKMHAMVAEAWPDQDQAGREKRRKALIKTLSAAGSESSKKLTDGEWDDLFHTLGEIKEGHVEFALRSRGGFELRPVVGASA